MIKIGDMVEIGLGTSWGGKFQVLQIVKIFQNGKTAVKVRINGKFKVFNV